MYKLTITRNWLDDNAETISIEVGNYQMACDEGELFAAQGYGVIITLEE